MANKALIQGELGVYTKPQNNFNIITDKMDKAMDGFIKRDDAKRKNLAKKIADVEADAQKILDGKSQSAVPDSFDSDEYINAGVNAFIKDPNSKNESSAKSRVEEVNEANKDILQKKVQFKELALDSDGNPTDVNFSSFTNEFFQNDIDRNFRILGGEVNGKMNDKTKKYTFYDTGTSVESDGTDINLKKTEQDDLMDNLVPINDDFRSKALAAFNKIKEGKNKKGNPVSWDIESTVRSKNQAISAFFDAPMNMTSPYEALGKPSWAVPGKEFDIEKVRQGAIDHYGKTLSKAQSTYNINNPDKISETKTKSQINEVFLGRVKVQNKLGLTQEVRFGSVSVSPVKWVHPGKKGKPSRLSYLVKTGASGEEVSMKETTQGQWTENHPANKNPFLFQQGLTSASPTMQYLNKDNMEQTIMNALAIE